MINSIKVLFSKYREFPLVIQITTLLIVSYYLYAAMMNPVMGFVFDGIAFAVSAIYELIIWFAQYFAVIFMLFTILTFAIKKKIYRNTIWFILGIGISVLGSFRYFGEFSWNPINFSESIDYISFEIKIMFFYYVMILTMLPTKHWMKFSLFFIGMLGVAATGVSIIPFVGGYISSLIDLFAKFSLFVFFILNAAALLLVTVEKHIYVLLKRDMSDINMIDLDEVKKIQDGIKSGDSIAVQKELNS